MSFSLSKQHPKITKRKVSSLKPYANNARTHSTGQIELLAQSIKEFGWTSPILIDENNTVLAGHGRLAAAQLLGLEKAPTICITHLTEVQKKAYVLADNKLAENAGWDCELLTTELAEIKAIDAEFDISVLGFEPVELDQLLNAGNNDNDNDDDNEDDFVLSLELGATVARRGDLWLLGEHKLLCGDAMSAEAYAKLLGNEKASMIFTDPPYNVPVEGFVSGNGNKKHKNFAMASGEMTPAEFTDFLQDAMRNMAIFSKDGSLHYICMDWRHCDELLAAAKSTYTEHKNLCVWNKSNAGMGSFYRSKHEFVFVFKNGKAKHINNIELGKHGRDRTNVWDYPSASGFSKTRMADLAAHPTVKPTAMVSDAILDASSRGDIILDPFCGSGTTILAAEHTERCAAAIEIEPCYVDVAIKRWQELSGEKAILASTSEAFDDLVEERTVWHTTKEAA